MQSVLNILETRISEAMAKVPGSQGCPALVRPATDAKFGDYQVNGVMPLAKQLKTNPRKLAEQIVAKLDSATADKLSDICETPEIAGPGFINLRLKPELVAANLLQISKDADRLGIEKAEKPKTIVVDFSGPNIAKQMHVGHLRSTIIGDCICRLLELQGHKVIRQNHIGDWGLPMGMLIAIEQELKEKGGAIKITSTNETVAPDGRIIPPSESFDFVPIREIEKRYKDANKRVGTNPQFAEKAKKSTFALQNNDPEAKWYWQKLCLHTMLDCYDLYKKLSVGLTEWDVRGESFYKDMLADVVVELKKKGLAVESEGAVCIFPEGFKDKEGKPLPVIVQKSDGAYLYATTDLAAIRYRVDKLKADRIIYVTDSRQSLHFEMVFAVARMAGWDVKRRTEDGGLRTEFVHVTFGSVLGEDGKPLKTRSGENVKLKELLDEAVERARKVVEEKNPGLSEDEKKKIANAVGIGAVKYADYTNNRTSDYIFSFDKMLAMEGNTAPYMQYAYARIRSIERKAQTRNIDIETELAGIGTLSITEPSELDLAKHLIRYGEAVQSSAGDYRPNYLTAYLYDLAQKFSSFYNDCPVLDASPDKRPTRLLLCDLTAKTIEHGLHNLLGIEVIEQM
ncbi:MAG: arginine--tRNA ligase [Sedimentisphaerales bacterium]|jgi:arginyl-tRNA synthetase